MNNENIKISNGEIILDKSTVINNMIKGLDKAMKDMFESSYSNPIRDILKKEFEKQDFRGLLSSVIQEIIKSSDLREKVKDIIAEQIIMNSLK